MSYYDYGKGPDEKDWSKHSELLNTGSQGWNIYQRLPIIMMSEIPWMRKFALSFAADEPDNRDVEVFLTKGWKPMRAEHFGEIGLKSFNNTVGSRFNLVSVDGTVRYNNHVLMIKPKDLRDEQIRRQHEEFEEYYASIMKQTYTHPKDPRHDEMAARASSGLTEDTYIRDPGSEITKKKITRKSESKQIEE